MNYLQYKEEVIEQLKSFYDIDAEVSISEVIKNNGLILDGVNIKLFDDNTNIVPVIYLNSFYENGVSVENCVGRIIEMRAGCSNPSFDYDEILELTQWEAIKDKVFPILVSTEANLPMLEKFVSKAFLDLSILYVVKIDDLGSDSLGTVKITKDLFSNYSISEEQLYEQSVMNLKAEGYRLQDMMEVLTDMFIDNEVLSDDEITNVEMESGRMYVLTNKSKMYGAAGILDTALLHSLGASFYILPSSVHETIFVPEDDNMDQFSLDAMVAEVNATQLSREEVLSGHSYYYDFTTNEIRIRKCA